MRSPVQAGNSVLYPARTYYQTGEGLRPVSRSTERASERSHDVRGTAAEVPALTVTSIGVHKM